MTDTEPQSGPPGDEPQEKTAKQLEKEAKKAAKLDKLKAKLDKKSTTPAVQKDKPEVIYFFNSLWIFTYSSNNIYIDLKLCVTII